MASAKEVQKLTRIENDGRQLAEDISKLPKELVKISQCLRSLHAERAIATESEHYEDIINLRNDMRKCATVYVKLVQPFLDEILRYLRRITNIHLQDNFAEWENNSDDLLSMLTECIDLCVVTLALFAEITPTLKRNEDDSKALKLYVEEKSKTLAAAENKQHKRSAWTALGTIAAVGGATLGAAVAVVTLPLAVGGAAFVGYSQWNASSLKTQRDLSTADDSFLCHSMIEPVKSLNDTLEKLFSFITTQKEDLVEVITKEKLEDKRNYCAVMKSMAAPVGQSCKETISSIPNVMASLKSIPSDDMYEWSNAVGATMKFLDETKITKARGEKLHGYLKLSESHHCKSSKAFRKRIKDMKQNLKNL